MEDCLVFSGNSRRLQQEIIKGEEGIISFVLNFSRPCSLQIDALSINCGFVIELRKRNSPSRTKMSRRIPNELGSGEVYHNDNIKSYHRINTLHEIKDSESIEIKEAFKKIDISVLVSLSSLLYGSDIEKETENVSAICTVYNFQKVELLCELRLFYSIVKNVTIDHSKSAVNCIKRYF